MYAVGHTHTHTHTHTQTTLGCVSVLAKDSVSWACDVMAGWLSAVTATPVTILDLPVNKPSGCASVY